MSSIPLTGPVSFSNIAQAYGLSTVIPLPHNHVVYQQVPGQKLANTSLGDFLGMKVPALHFDANHYGHLSSGEAVTTAWQNRGSFGSNYNAAPRSDAATTVYPKVYYDTNSKPYVNLDRAHSQYFHMTPSITWNLSTGFSVIMVGRMGSLNASGGDRIVDFASGPANNTLLWTRLGSSTGGIPTGRFEIYNGASVQILQDNTGNYFEDNIWQIYAISCDPTSSATAIRWYKGTSSTPALSANYGTYTAAMPSSKTTPNNYIGKPSFTSNSYSAMDIRELMVFDTAIPHATMMSLITKLNAKWFTTDTFYTLPTASASPVVVSFTTVGSTTWTCPANVRFIDVLIVGGGGGAGCDGAGGGGGGGVIYRKAHPVIPGTTYTVVVGGGGAAAPGTANGNGSSGGNSSFGSMVALGGGGGASGWQPTSFPTSGTGASSGGGGFNFTTNTSGVTVPPGSETVGQGCKGGTAAYYAAGGGGGGAGGPGGNATGYGSFDPNSRGGNGGKGFYCAITGTGQYYGGGGGGGCWFATGGTGGLGGGGNGGSNGNNGTTGAQLGQSGTANTGGGGGGNGYNAPNGGGGAGGSGIVIVRY